MRIKPTIAFILATALIGCGPMRPPVPAGTIPKPPILTQDDEQYGHDVLSELSEQFELERDDAKVERARRIVDRLTASIGANQDPWHVYVFNSPETKNAAATRGNHVFLWSGIMIALPDDSELAIVIAHEIAHVLADHARQSESEQTATLLSQIAAAVAQTAILYNGGDDSIADIAADLTEGTMNGIITNPESQRKELEADIIGLHLLAEAGLDPHLALNFWKKNLNNPDFDSGLPQFFSSHPSSEDRLTEIERNLPAAMERFRKSSVPTW